MKEINFTCSFEDKKLACSFRVFERLCPTSEQVCLPHNPVTDDWDFSDISTTS